MTSLAAAPTVRANDAPRLVLDGDRYELVRGFAYVESRRFEDGWNRGVDVRVPRGEVASPTDGVVRFAGRVAGRNVVTIATRLDDMAVVVTLTGLDRVDVERGTRVWAGATLGDATRLHFGMYDPARRTRYLPVAVREAKQPASRADSPAERSPVADAVARRLLDAVNGREHTASKEHGALELATWPVAPSPSASPDLVITAPGGGPRPVDSHVAMVAPAGSQTASARDRQMAIDQGRASLTASRRTPTRFIPARRVASSSARSAVRGVVRASAVAEVRAARLTDARSMSLAAGRGDPASIVAAPAAGLGSASLTTRRFTPERGTMIDPAVDHDAASTSSLPVGAGIGGESASRVAIARRWWGLMLAALLALGWWLARRIARSRAGRRGVVPIPIHQPAAPVDTSVQVEAVLTARNRHEHDDDDGPLAWWLEDRGTTPEPTRHEGARERAAEHA